MKRTGMVRFSLIATVVMALMACFALAACGGGSGKSEVIELDQYGIKVTSEPADKVRSQADIDKLMAESSYYDEARLVVSLNTSPNADKFQVMEHQMSANEAAAFDEGSLDAMMKQRFDSISGGEDEYSLETAEIAGMTVPCIVTTWTSDGKTYCNAEVMLDVVSYDGDTPTICRIEGQVMRDDPEGAKAMFSRVGTLPSFEEKRAETAKNGSGTTSDSVGLSADSDFRGTLSVEGNNYVNRFFHVNVVGQFLDGKVQVATAKELAGENKGLDASSDEALKESLKAGEQTYLAYFAGTKDGDAEAMIQVYLYYVGDDDASTVAQNRLDQVSASIKEGGATVTTSEVATLDVARGSHSGPAPAYKMGFTLDGDTVCCESVVVKEGEYCLELTVMGPSFEKDEEIIETVLM